MVANGLLSHIDLNVSDPARSIPVYAALLEALGWQRAWVEPAEGRDDGEEISPADRCAWWAIQGSSIVNIEIRPPAKRSTTDRHERYAPGLDHLAFHAESQDMVDQVHEHLERQGIAISHPPRDYGGGYYALGFDDPDGIHLEVVHDPSTNP